MTPYVDGARYDTTFIDMSTGYPVLTTIPEWVAPRMAMIRYAEKSKGIFLTKVPTADNLADIITKPLVGDAFIKHRAALLCL
jgi:hypothetical protein